MLNAVSVGATLASLLAATPVLTSNAAEPSAAPEGVSVQVVTANGSGCPAAQGTAVLSADGTSVTLSSPGYFAWSGGAARPTDFRRNCQLSLQVTRPQGWTYAINRIDSTGYAFLAAGATGTSRVISYFQGMPTTGAWTHLFAGPMADTWATTDVVQAGALAYAPCGTERNLNINTELRTGAGSSTPSANNFMIRDGQTTVGLVWQPCA